MSLNLGNEGVDACRRLRGNSDFEALHDKLAKLVNQTANAALECLDVTQADKAGYARALRDLWVAIESAVSGESYNAVKKPGVVQTRARVREDA